MIVKYYSHLYQVILLTYFMSVVAHVMLRNLELLAELLVLGFTAIYL